MNEVEKMYENAEPNRDCNLYKHFTECPMKHTQCEDCENFVYPPFTAEKQLLLLQWLLDRTDLYLHRHKTDFTYSIASGDIAVNKYKDFKESIAEFINALWQDLTEEERKQIKEILSE